MNGVTLMASTYLVHLSNTRHSKNIFATSPNHSSSRGSTPLLDAKRRAGGGKRLMRQEVAQG